MIGREVPGNESGDSRNPGNPRGGLSGGLIQLMLNFRPTINLQFLYTSGVVKR